MTYAEVTGINFSEWAKSNLSETLGFSLLSDTYDPAHLLHQFVKNSTGFRDDNTYLARQLLASQGSRSTPVPNSKLREIAQEHRFSLPAPDSSLNHMRRDLALTLASDKLIFPSEGSFQVASSFFTGANRSASDLSKLLFGLVASDDQGIELLTRVRQRLSEPQSNGFWILQNFLQLKLDDGPMPDLNELEMAAPPSWLTSGRGKEISDFVAHLLKQCLRGIAYGSDTLYAIRTLAMGLTWSSALLAIHAPSIITGDRLLTLLVEVKPSRDLSTIRNFASEESYGGISRSYDYWLHSCLVDRVKEDWADIPFSHEGVIHYLRETKGCFAMKTNAATEQATRLAQDDAVSDAGLLWDSTPSPTQQSSREQVTVEIARILRNVLRAGLQPERWYSSRARFCGFLYPRRQGDKRLTFEPALLPLLILGLFDEGQRILELPELLTRAHERLGIVVGPNEADTLISPRPSIPELEMNLIALIESLVQLGLARSYGDSVTEVLYPRQLLGREA